MNSYKIKLACVALFVISAAAQAQSSDSNSGSTSGSNSSSTGIGQGGGSSLNTVNSTSSSNTKSSSTSIGGVAISQGGSSTSAASLHNSGNSSSASAVRSSGNSSIVVNLASATGTGSGSSTDPSGTGAVANTGAVSKDAAGAGTSPYNTISQVDYSGTQTVKTNPAIQAPGLTTTLSDTCMGSISLGVSLPGFGATGGTTLVDQACVRRLDAREFRAMGLTDVALALLCQSDANRRAVESTGHLCPGTTHPLAKVDANDNNTGTVADDVKYRDPLVRGRMGLPPLSGVTFTRQQAEAEQPAPAPTQAPAPVVTTPNNTPTPVVSPAAKPTEPAATVMTVPVTTVPTQVAVLR
jgi:hypothetical protein